MHLINVHSMKLEEFADDRVAPSYAILSHRWEDEEVSFKEMKRGKGNWKKGFRKIELCCKQAADARLDYAWVDKVAIDKRSSAQLSEAINSMYQWYQNASICYAYLSDVEAGTDIHTKADPPIRDSLWFTRGWTLQELIAPKEVEFYDVNWTFLGTRTSLQNVLSQISGVPVSLLTRKKAPVDYSIAQRMSWAARRQTTRVEDIAYCMLGIFRVNMPLLYGEGEKAFIRLQEEIIKRSDDESIFAWPGICSGCRTGSTPCTGLMDLEIATAFEASKGCLLARTPLLFAGCTNIARTSAGMTPYHAQHYAFTNIGLSIRLPMMPTSLDTYFAFLNCYPICPRDEIIGSQICGIHLRRVEDGRGATHFARLLESNGCLPTEDPVHLTNDARWQDIIIRDAENLSQFTLAHLSADILFGFHLVLTSVLDLSPVIHSRSTRYPVQCDSFGHTKIEMPQGVQCGAVGVVALRDSLATDHVTLIHFAFDYDFNVAIQVCTQHDPITTSDEDTIEARHWADEGEIFSDLSTMTPPSSAEFLVFEDLLDPSSREIKSGPQIWSASFSHSLRDITIAVRPLNGHIKLLRESQGWTATLLAINEDMPAFWRISP